MALNDAELRFQAQLEDNVSPNLRKLEQQLRQMGASKHQINMALKAVDEASPKIKEAQRTVDTLPKEHIIKVQVDRKNYQRDMDMVRREAEKPIKLNFVHNLQQIANEVFTLRSRVPVQLGMVPGAQMLYAGGPLGAAFGGAAGAVGAVGQGVALQTREEQSLITLEQTLKDSTKAQREMAQIIETAKKTPFGYEEVLAADVRLRSYQMPTMPGEGGPGNQGWMKLAGDMAAAMSTPLNQAVEAVADARQGYFVRMMSYGIRMMREDFEKGGKYAGLSYEQGLERALRRFEGSQEMQAKSFQGIMSNLKDVLQQDILKPLGAAPFELIRGQAAGLQERFLDPDFQRELEGTMEKIQRGMIDFFDLLQRGKDYFDNFLKEPLQDFADSLIRVGKIFATTFGGTFLEVLQTAGKLFMEIIKPLGWIIDQVPAPLLQIYGVFKALSVLGFDNISKPFLALSGLMMGIPGSAGGLTGFISALVALPKAIAGAGLLLLVKNLTDAANASSKLEAQFYNLRKTDAFEKMNDEIRAMAHGLDQSTTNMQKLVSVAEAGLPDTANRSADMRRSVLVGRYGATLERDFGVEAEGAVRMIVSELNRRKDYDEEAIKKAAESVRNVGAAADLLNMSMRDAARTMQMFGKQAGAAGLGGTTGLPAVMAMSASMSDNQLRTVLSNYANPSMSFLQPMARAEQMDARFRPNRFSSVLGNWDWQSLGGDRARELGGRFQEIRGTYEANIRADDFAQRRMSAIAPDARLPRTPNPFLERGLGVDWSGIRGAGSPAEQARRTMVELEEQTSMIDNQAQAMANLQDEINRLTGFQQQLAVATDDLNLKMAEFQRTLLPIQQAIERQSYAMGQFQFDNIRPLERAMQRLGDENTRLSNRMREAQYEMQKYSSGMLMGEQAVQDQLYALEKYNKQLQWLQLQYSSIGAELGRSTFDRGASVRVAPLMGLNLQMQMERLARRQQREQLEYDLTFGDQRRTLELAGRSRMERQEIPFGERLAGVRNAVTDVDALTEAQRRNSREQGRIQEAMIPYNQQLADMQDNVTRLNLQLQKANTSKHAQGLQTQIADLGLENQRTAKHITAANLELTRQEAIIEDVKDQAKLLTDALAEMILFDEDDPTGLGKRIIEQAYKAGTINKETRDAALRRIQAVSEEVGKVSRDNVRTDEDWVSIIKRGIMGIFGDTWRSIGAKISQWTRGTPLEAGGSAAGSIISGLGPIAAGAALPLGVLAGGAFVGRQAMLRGAGALISMSPRLSRRASRIGGAIERRARTRLERAESRGQRRRARFWAGRVEFGEQLRRRPGVAITSLAGRVPFWRGLRQQFNPLRRLISPLVGAGAFTAGTVLSGGNPLGGMLLRRQVGNWLDERTMRQAARDIVRGARDIRRTPRNMRNAIKESGDNAKRAIRSGGDGFERKATKVADKMDDAAKKIRLRGGGRFASVVGAFAATVGAFGDKIKDFGGWVSKFFGGPADKVDDAARAAGQARASTEAARRGVQERARIVNPQAYEKAQTAYKAGKFQTAMKWLNRATLGAIGVQAGLELLEGDPLGAADVASYAVPGAGQVRLAGDLGAFRAIDRMTGGNLDEGARVEQRNILGRRLREIAGDPGRRLVGSRTLGRREAGVLQDIEDAATAAGDAANEARRHGMIQKAEEFQKKEEALLERYTIKKQRFLAKAGDQINEKEAKRQSDHYKDLSDHYNYLIALGAEHWNNREKADAKGTARLKKIMNDYLGDTKKSVNNFRRDLGLVDTPNDTDRSDDVTAVPNKPIHRMASGGHIIKGKGDGRGALYWAGEEDDEMVIPLAPHRRERAKSLLRQAAGRIAMANGAIDPAYEQAKKFYGMASTGMSFANGGSPIDVMGSKPGFAVLMAHFRKITGDPSLFVMSGFRENSRILGTGSISNHASGDAIDISNPASDQGTEADPPPQNSLDRLYPYLQRWPQPPRRDLLWRTMTGGNHFNHIHLGMDPSVTANIRVANAFIEQMGGKKITEAMLASMVQGVDPLKLRRVPRRLRGMGAFGRLLFDTLRKQRRDVLRSATTADVDDMTGGGDAAENQRLGRRMAARLGWRGDEWQALRTLWHGESGWRTDADNPTSTAYGIPQALTSMHKLPADYKTNPASQIRWGLNYIKDRYGSPSAALAAWQSRSPHWYAPGIDNVLTDRLAFLHRGERVQNVAEASTTRAQRGTGFDKNETRRAKLMEIIEDIRDKIKKTERHLRKADERAEKRGDARDLAALNEQLRRRFGQVRQVQRRAQASLRRSLRGDESGGEGTEALVDREQRTFRRMVRAGGTRRDRALVRRVTRLGRSARTLLRTADTPRERTLARRAVRATGRARTAATRVTRAAGRARYIRSAARRGVDARLIRDITGQRMRRPVRRAYQAVQRARGTAGTRDDRRARQRLNRALQNEMKGLRKDARQAANKATRATQRAAAAQGRKIDRQTGRLVGEAEKRSKKAREATARVAEETKKNRGESRKHDDKRSKAEINADKRERKFQKEAINLLKDLNRKDHKVEVHNTATGATLTTTVRKGNQRKR